MKKQKQFEIVIYSKLINNTSVLILYVYSQRTVLASSRGYLPLVAATWFITPSLISFSADLSVVSSSSWAPTIL